MNDWKEITNDSDFEDFISNNFVCVLFYAFRIDKSSTSIDVVRRLMIDLGVPYTKIDGLANHHHILTKYKQDSLPCIQYFSKSNVWNQSIDLNNFQLIEQTVFDYIKQTSLVKVPTSSKEFDVLISKGLSLTYYFANVNDLHIHTIQTMDLLSTYYQDVQFVCVDARNPQMVELVMKRNVKMFPGFQFSSNGILMDYHPELIYDVRVILESLYPTIVNVPKGRQMVEESFSKKIQTSQRHRRPTIFKLPNDTNPQNNSRSVSIDVNGEKKKNSIFNVISEAVKQNTLNQAKDYEKNVFLAGPKRSVSLDKYLKNYDFDDQEEDDILNSYILPNHALLVDTPQTSFSLDESTNLDGSSRRGTNELLPESSFISQLPSKGLPPPRMSKKYSFGKPVSFYKAKKDFGNIQAMSFDSISSAWESQDDVNNLSRTSLADQKEPLESISIPISNITKPELKTVSLLIPEPEIPKTIPNQPKINHFHTATLTENVTKPDISVKINEIKIDPIIKVDVPIKPVDVPIKTVDERANKSTLELPPMIDLVLANRANSMMTNETQMKLEKSVDLFPSIGQLKTTSSSTIKSVHYNIFTQPNPDKSCVEKLFQAFQTVYQNQQINGIPIRKENSLLNASILEATKKNRDSTNQKDYNHKGQTLTVKEFLSTGLMKENVDPDLEHKDKSTHFNNMNFIKNEMNSNLQFHLSDKEMRVKDDTMTYLNGNVKEFTIDSKGHESFSTSGYGVKFMDQEPSFPIIESKSKHRKKGKKFQPKRTKKTVYDYDPTLYVPEKPKPKPVIQPKIKRPLPDYFVATHHDDNESEDGNLDHLISVSKPSKKINHVFPPLYSITL